MRSSDHKDTINNKYLLGQALFELHRLKEAEQIFPELVSVKEMRSPDHEDTLNSKYWLGQTLFELHRFKEAEQIFREVVTRDEAILSPEHKTTLGTKQWLGKTLFEQQRYKEAEEILRQVVVAQERRVGPDHDCTIRSKHLLGRIFYLQENFVEAEKMFGEVVAVIENDPVRQYHEETLTSKHLLGNALCQLGRYQEAEKILRQALAEEEKRAGYDQGHTVQIKSWLTHAQEKYREEQQQQQQYEQRNHEDTLEKEQQDEHGNQEDTLETVRLLQEVQIRSPSLSSTSSSTQSSVADRLSIHFSNTRDSRDPYTDADILEVSRLLKQLNSKWSKVPRTYIVLRSIGHLNFLDDLIDIDFSDYWFPVTSRRLPDCLPPSVRLAFVASQRLVMTKSMDLEKGERGQHCRFEQDEALPFERKGVLGRGGFGQVDKVLSLISFKTYARKRVRRSDAFKGSRTKDTTQFIAEIEILKRLKHHHIVEFVGSYTDSKYIGLIMSPVAQMNLNDYLRRPSTSNPGELRTFFGCLARALEFLHEQQVRHKDIKPANILIDGGNVLFTDFGLSHDFTDATGSTTVSMVNGMTPRYCAPEVALSESRNTKSDIWSSGVVFMEMITVLKGKRIE